MLPVKRILFSILICGIGNAAIASTGRQLLAGYWGQNIAAAVRDDGNEKSLKEVCQTSKYDILNVAFLNEFFDTRNQDSLPSLSLAHHCTQSISETNPYLLRCPKIEEGIKECQRLGKKVLISIGGAAAQETLESPAKARELAHTLYDLFLGGDRRTKEISLRPFGSAVMNGVDLFIEAGRPQYYSDFIRELRRLMDSETGAAERTYLITAAPYCLYPDPYLGPEEDGTALKEASEYVDYLFVKFYNSYCHTGDQKSFIRTLDKWLSFAQSNNGPLVFVGLPADPLACMDAIQYRKPKELKVIYEKFKTRPGLGGIMLWDISWDQNNIIDGSRYSDYVFALLKDTLIVRPNASKAPPNASATSPGQEITPIQGPFSCAGEPDGTYPNSSDCSKYYTCDGGDMYEKHCPPGLFYNAETKLCNWPENVEC